MKLSDVLSNPNNFDSSGWLYLRAGAKPDLDSDVLILKSEEIAPEHELLPDAGVPIEAKERGFSQVLQMADVEDVVINAQMQKSDVSLAELLVAFKFYLDHDAFIEL